MNNILSYKIVQAHCDVPCGIYDPSTAQIAALSVARFLNLIADIDDLNTIENLARLNRLVQEKETHAGIVKSEIVIIWGDYFKEAQIEICPDIHNLTHSILREASKCKQEIAQENGLELVRLVNEFTKAFWLTKGIETESHTSPYEPSLPLVRPILSN